MRYAGYHAHWFVADEVEVSLCVYWNDRARYLVRQAAKVIEPLRDIVKLSAHFGDQLTVVANLGFGQFPGLAGDQVPQFVQKRSTSAVCQLRPWTFGKCRSEEHTSELQSLMRISYAVFCLKKKNVYKRYISRTSSVTRLLFTETDTGLTDLI